MSTKLCFLVGSMAISGGTYVIVQHASYLQDHGFDITLAVQEPFTAETLTWHDRAPTLRCIPIDQARSETYDLVIATWWKTALELAGFNAPRFAYFVQSIESRFYPEAERPLRALVDATYAFPVSYVTEARWIRAHLAAQYGQNAALVPNGIRKDVYTPNGPRHADRVPGKPRVLIEGHFGVSFKNTALGLKLAREAGAEDIWVLTGSPVSWVPGASRIFSRVKMLETPLVYRSCDILVKLSTVEGMFGPPLEIFHCGGTAVVYDVTGHDEYIVSGVNAMVEKQGDADGVVKALHKLLNDAGHLTALKCGALKTAAEWPAWETSSENFSQWVNTTLETQTTHKETIIELTRKAWETYAVDEKDRLQRNPAIVRRHKASAFFAKLPPVFLKRTKQLEAIGEVLFHSRKTH